MIADPPAKDSTRRPPPPSLDVGHGREVRRDRAGDRETMPSPQARLDTDSDASRAHLEEEFVFDAHQEDAYWDANHDSQAWADTGDFALFAPAYRTGYEGFERFGEEYDFDDVEDELEEAYELEGSDLPWDDARDAARAAWDRLVRRRDAAGEAGAPVP